MKEQRLLDRKWDVDYKRYVEKQEEFEENYVKAYAFIFDNYCSKEMQVALKELPDFELLIRNDPLQLLENVEKLMHT